MSSGPVPHAGEAGIYVQTESDDTILGGNVHATGDPPGAKTRARGTGGGGAIPRKVRGKPLETMGRQSYGATAEETSLCSPGCDFANHGKPWDCKVMGAKARKSTENAPCQPGRRTLCVRNVQRKEETHENYEDPAQTRACSVSRSCHVHERYAAHRVRGLRTRRPLASDRRTGNPRSGYGDH